jgi:hypothetical protein
VFLKYATTYRRVDNLSRRWTELGVLSAIETALEKIGFDDRYVDAMIASAADGSDPDAQSSSG